MTEYFDFESGYIVVESTPRAEYFEIESSNTHLLALTGNLVEVPSPVVEIIEVAAETAVNTGSIDGVTVAAGDRILFTGITGENKHVFTVTGTPGSGATLTEITNTLENNDAILVDEGTAAGCQFHYNQPLTDWVKTNPNLDEQGFIRALVGKTGAGSETPDYTSTN